MKIEEIQIEPTIECNLDCIMCNKNAKKRGKKHMKVEEFEKIVKQFRQLKKIHLHGFGEPLLNPKLDKMIKTAKKRGVTVVLNTNGACLTKGISKRILKAGLDELRVSIDSPIEEKFAKIRRGGRLNQVLQNIKAVIEQINNIKSKTNLVIVFVLMEENYTDLPEMVKLVSRLGIKKLVVQRKLNWGKWKYDRLPNNKVEQCFEKAKAVAKESGVRISLPPLEEKKQNCCIWPFNSLFVTVEGFITPCCVLAEPKPEFTFGNILTQELDEIWNSSKYNLFRQRICSNNPSRPCKNCAISKGTFKDYALANNMLAPKLHPKINQIKDELVCALGKSLKLMVLFGSANDQSQIDTFSDIDLFVVTDKVNVPVLENIAKIRDESSDGIPIDIKLFSTEEWDSSDKVPISMLHSWTKKMMLFNFNKILFMNPNIKIKSTNNKLELVVAAGYFFDKLKKYFMKETVYLRGKISTVKDKEFFKIVSSATFCISKFRLALDGAYVFTKEEIIENYKNRPNIQKILKDLYQARKDNRPNKALLDRSFEISKELYFEMLKEA